MFDLLECLATKLAAWAVAKADLVIAVMATMEMTMVKVTTTAEQKTATPEGFPFRSPYVKRLPAYSPDMCPRTRDLMTRVGMIGILPTDTPEWASAYAGELNQQLAKAFDV